MKLYVHFEGGGDAKEEDQALTLKLTLPKKWVSQPLLQVLELFIESYNKKKASLPPLDVNDVHLENAEGKTLQTSEIVEDVLSDRADLYVKPGGGAGGGGNNSSSKSAVVAPPTGTQQQQGGGNGGQGQLRCKNYGCNQFFSKEGNTDSACKFHTAPPVFHDTKKGWSCCTKRVYDWDEFHTIEGCATGPHSTINPKNVFAPSPTLAAATAAASSSQGSNGGGNNGAAPVVVKSIEQFNRDNPEAVTASKAAAASVKKTTTKCTVKPDGSATCLNKGCQKTFHVKENHPKACCYHQAGPVFHDAGKFWSCCPGVVKYDFDDFLKIPGCMVSSHYDGSPESLAEFEAQAQRREG